MRPVRCRVWAPALDSRSVQEIAISLVLLGLGLALAATPPVPGMWGTVVVGGASLVVGAIASLVYHARLRRALRAQGALPMWWWVHPVPYHARLEDDPDVRDAVMRAFYVGVASAVVSLTATVAGLVFVARFIWTS